MCVSCLWQVMRQTQDLKESLSFSSGQVSALTAEMQQLKAELEQCRQKAVTDQEQVNITCSSVSCQGWGACSLYHIQTPCY